jgi:hypothetical protein
MTRSESSVQQTVPRQSLPIPKFYWRDVYPIVAEMSVKAIAKATGLTSARASAIRSGKDVPHARWWEALVPHRPRSSVGRASGDCRRNSEH